MAHYARMVNQDRPPNFRNEEGDLYLVRCFNCDEEHGRENWAIAVATGQCCWCGWKENDEETASR